MAGRFPELEDLGPLSAGEWATLRSLHHAYVELEQELRAARAVAERLLARCELAADAPPGGRPHFADAVGALYHEAFDYARKTGALAWRYASADVMVAFTVWRRVADGQSPLSEEVLAETASREPTIGELCSVLDDPITIRPDDEQAFDQGMRRRLRDGLDQACVSIAHQTDGAPGPRIASPEAALALRLSTDYPGGLDPLWDVLIEQVLYLAEQLPYDIAHVLHAQRDRHAAVETP